jgi:large subunit ribosomal protein L10
LAFSKKHKGELLSQYGEWLKQSQAVFVIEYKRMGMKEIDTLRAKVRESGGQVHVVKNTVMKLALQQAGIQSGDIEGSALFGFTANPPVMAKSLMDATNRSEVFKLKGGYLGGHAISVEDVKALAELPPLPVMRARLLGVISAPASKLVRTLAEPSRQVARVLKAYSEQDPIPAAA